MKEYKKKARVIVVSIVRIKLELIHHLLGPDIGTITCPVYIWPMVDRKGVVVQGRVRMTFTSSISHHLRLSPSLRPYRHSVSPVFLEKIKKVLWIYKNESLVDKKCKDVR